MLDALRDATAMCLSLTAEVLHTVAELVSPTTHGGTAYTATADYQHALHLIRTAHPSLLQ